MGWIACLVSAVESGRNKSSRMREPRPPYGMNGRRAVRKVGGLASITHDQHLYPAVRIALLLVLRFRKEHLGIP